LVPAGVPRFLFGRRTAARWKVDIGIDGCIPYLDRAVIADGHGEDVPARLEALGIARPQ